MRAKIILALLICCAAGLVSDLLGADKNWDLLNYHLYAPYAYLRGRYLYDVGPGQLQSFSNPTADFILYGLTSSFLNEFPRVVAFVMGAIHGINAVMIMAISDHVLRANVRWERLTVQLIAFAIGVTGAGAISLLGTSTGDLINSIFILASLLTALKVVARPITDNGRVLKFFAWSGLLIGIGIGLKYTAAIYAPGLTFVLASAAVRHRTIVGFITFGASAVIGMLLTAGHHLLTLWVLFKNPIFPLMNNVFQSPYYEPLALRDLRLAPRNFWQTVAYPFYWAQMNGGIVTELQFRDLRCAIAYVAVVAGALLIALRTRAWYQSQSAFSETRGLSPLFAFVAISYCFWALGFGIYRFFVTIEMLTGVIIIGAILWLVPNRLARMALAVAALCVAASTTVYFQWGRRTFGNKYIEVSVPDLPKNSLVLIPTSDAVAYFIPFAESTARYLGIQNNYLRLSQRNFLSKLVRELMDKSPGPKFVLVVNRIDTAAINKLLAEFRLHLIDQPCEIIQSNIDEKNLELCRTEYEGQAR